MSAIWVLSCLALLREASQGAQVDLELLILPLLTSYLLGLQAIARALFFEMYNYCSFIYNVRLKDIL